MKRRFFHILALLALALLVSFCQQQPPTLVRWSKEFVADAYETQDAYFDDHEHFIADYFSEETRGDTLVVTTLMMEHCVDSSIGIITYDEKNIYLKTHIVMADERYCPVFYKYTYVIYNPSQTRYSIVSEK